MEGGMGVGDVERETDWSSFALNQKSAVLLFKVGEYLRSV